MRNRPIFDYVTFSRMRRKRNRSLEEFSEKLETRLVNIRNWENGRYSPDLREVIKMSEILQCSVADLYVDRKGEHSFSFNRADMKNIDGLELDGFVLSCMRHEAGFTLVQFGKKIGWSAGSVQLYEVERYKPKKIFLYMVARFFKVEIRDLCKNDKRPNYRDLCFCPDKFRALRIKMQMRRGQFARKTGNFASQIIMYEQGQNKVPLYKIIKMAERLQVLPHEICK